MHPPATSLAVFPPLVDKDLFLEVFPGFFSPEQSSFLWALWPSLHSMPATFCPSPTLGLVLLAAQLNCGLCRCLAPRFTARTYGDPGWLFLTGHPGDAVNFITSLPWWTLTGVTLMWEGMRSTVRAPPVCGPGGPRQLHPKYKCKCVIYPSGSVTVCWWWCWASSHMTPSHLYVFFGKLRTTLPLFFPERSWAPQHD